MFDYEFAIQQHNVGCRLRAAGHDAGRIPPDRLARYGAGPEKLAQYPGPQRGVLPRRLRAGPRDLERLGVDRTRVLVVSGRRPTCRCTTGASNRSSPQVVARLGGDEGVHAIVVPRTEEQRAIVRALRLPSLIVPDGAVDAQSLIALADLVVSAGGTMNREAVALGTPVYTTYGGRLGGVDEALIRRAGCGR